MGAGRKTQTFIHDESNPCPPLTGNSDVLTRNLRKSDLGGVIFGCKHNTIKECLSKQLFGLPHGHFSYVRNIAEGLPLFLFNYSDRKLYGIYEAASHGHMSFDAYAWTDGGTERTPFPAQVYIRTGTQCQPLTENQFKKIIADNYFSTYHFWFELDHSQTRGLIALFKPSLPNGAMLSPFIRRNKELLPALPANKVASLSIKEQFPPLPATKWKAVDNKDHVNYEANRLITDQNMFANVLNENKLTSVHFNGEDARHAGSNRTSGIGSENTDSKEIANKGASLSKEQFPPLPATKWKAVDNKDHVNYEASRLITDQNMSANSLNENKLTSVHCNDEDAMRAGSNRTSGIGSEDTDSKETVSDWEDLEEDTIHNRSSVAKLDCANQSGNMGLEKEEKRVLHLLQKLAADREHLTSSSSGVHSTGSICTHEHAEDVKILAPPDVNFANDDDVEKLSMDGINHGNAKLVEIIEELKERTSTLEKQRAEKDQEMDLLRNAISDSGKMIQRLQDRVKELESKIVPSGPLVDDSRDKFIDQYFGLDDVIYLIGGFDGCSWLSALDCFSPSLNKITSMKSMCSARSYASAIPLDGIIYVFGGGDGNLWFDSVECYNQRHDEWTSCPSMLREKGSLAGATLNGKIFAIGGGDGVQCFSDVEMFDPAREMWINNESMLHTRFAPAAAELNGAIYALGGFDGNTYLRSVERFDPREGTWIEAPTMNIRRGCHSAAVLNEKLYCIGGYDGENMVSSMDIFDPRLNHWVMGEPMRFERGYAAAAVLGNSMFSIGGVKDNKNIVDTVECYREGTGWSNNSGWVANGKRCFFSAVVMSA